VSKTHCVVVDDMLFCIVTFNLWLHYNKLLTYLHQCQPSLLTASCCATSQVMLVFSKSCMVSIQFLRGLGVFFVPLISNYVNYHKHPKNNEIIPTTTNLPERFDRSCHLKIQLAQFTRLRICALYPLL